MEFAPKPVSYTHLDVYKRQEDHGGETVRGGFYEHEISKSSVGDVYLMEKVVYQKGLI